MKWKVGVYPYIFHISLFVFLIATYVLDNLIIFHICLFVFLIATYVLDNLILNIATLEEVDWRARVTWQGDVAGRRGRATWQGDVAGRRGRATWQGDVAGRRGRATWQLEGDAIRRRRKTRRKWNVRIDARHPRGPNIAQTVTLGGARLEV